ncbi:hypothetical protein [Streptomyces sp.]|uniref:hypothetical protein n=1 Tax=Streptomyces sp. TaxID=1931 RepID=UPI002D77863B|nr:hypothetical protein [Streptomyces sp.]HET6354661.1 hypothetical protein [Streptomyces sp.]
MAHRLTPRRLAALRAAAAHPMGNISPRIEMRPGETAWLTAADEIALEELGLGNSIDDCGHIQGSADPDGEHRSHPHLFRITAAGRQAVAT